MPTFGIHISYYVAKSLHMTVYILSLHALDRSLGLFRVWLNSLTSSNCLLAARHCSMSHLPDKTAE